MVRSVLRRLRRLLRDQDTQTCAPGARLPVLDAEELFPGLSGVEVRVPFRELHERHLYALPLPEYLLLGAICRYLQPRVVFEIGTFTGSTTLIMALNADPGCAIATLDLDDAHLAEVPGVTGGAGRFVVGAAFAGSPARQCITQHRGDSTTFDFTPWKGMADLVLVDGDHRYETVASDSIHALEMLAPTGTIIWDDYMFRPRFPECEGVSRWLHQSRLPACYRIAGTRLAIHRPAVAPR